jgi:hypothetical protein
VCIRKEAYARAKLQEEKKARRGLGPAIPFKGMHPTLSLYCLPGDEAFETWALGEYWRSKL